MQDEKRIAAEARLEIVADDVESEYGFRPTTIVKDGSKREALLQTVEDEKRIAMLVLGAAKGVDGPGPLVARLAGQESGDFPVPILVVPGRLTNEEVDALT